MKRRDILKELKKFRFNEPESSYVFNLAINIEIFASKLSRAYAKGKIEAKDYVEYKESMFEKIKSFEKMIEDIKKVYGEENGIL